MKDQIHPNNIRQILFLALLILVGYVIGKELVSFLGAFLGALTLYVLLIGTMRKLVIALKCPTALIALLLMLASFIILVLPVIWMGFVITEKASPFIQNPQIILDAVNAINTYLIDKFNIHILDQQNIEKITGQLIPIAQSTLGNTMAVLGNMVMTYLVLFFMLTNHYKIENWLKNNIPLHKDNAVKLLTESRSLIFSNAIGIPVVALLQGAVAMIGYSIFGVKDAILLGFLTAIASVIPMIGSMLIYVPLMIYQLSLGLTWQGIGIGLWGFILIGSVDNIARFLIQKKMANVHPLITILGVLIGVNIFGFLGIIFGPILLSIFIILIRIYVLEFNTREAEEA